MLTPATRRRIEDILERIRSGATVELQEMVWVQKQASSSSGIRNWLIKAQRERPVKAG